MATVSINLPIPAANNIAGEYPTGNKFSFRHLASGFDVNIPIKKEYPFEEKYVPTCGIQVSEMVIFRNEKDESIWSSSEKMPYSDVKKIMLSFFEENVWQHFQSQMPGISKQDAFGTYVVKIIPQKINFWNSNAWRFIAKEMIEKGEI